MKTVCERFDPDLLMLTHGQLDRAATLRLRAHLLVCPACRARLGKLRSLTGALATALANPSLGARTFRPAPPTAWLSVGLLVVALSLLGWRYATDVAPPAPPSVSAPVPRICPTEKPPAPPKMTCSPKGLAND